MKNFFLLFLLLALTAFAQEFKTYPYGNGSQLLGHTMRLKNGTVSFYFSVNDSLYISNTSDGGDNWSKPRYITIMPIIASSITGVLNFTCTQLSDGRIIVIWSNRNKNVFSSIISNDNGLSWSSEKELPLPNSLLGRLPLYSTIIGNNLIVSCASRSYVSSNLGENWSNFPIKGKVVLLKISNNKILGVSNYGAIYLSEDNGNTWIKKDSINSNFSAYFNLCSYKKNSYIIFGQNEQLYSSQIDSTSYKIQTPQKITKYIGTNILINTCELSDGILCGISSTRNSNNTSNANYFAKILLDSENDLKAPPIVDFTQITYNPILQYIQTKIKIRQYCPLNKVTLYYTKTGISSNIELNDNGINGDTVKNDNVWTGYIYHKADFDSIKYSFKILDSLNNEFNTKPNSKKLYSYNIGKSLCFDINNIYVPINSYGVLANEDIIYNGKTANRGYYGLPATNNTFLFSGGFLLSGKNGNKYWGNGVASASKIMDYVSGKIGSNVEENENIYRINANSVPFASEWQYWKLAVAAGAGFYDGDKDGIYNPIDKNNNGLWDANEDKPEMLGDGSYWCIYNDGVESLKRYFPDQVPMGINVKQTVFGYANSELKNTMYVRYQINNTGSKSEKLDSVYFSLWSDPDLGDEKDDLVGTDVSNSAIYCYNDGSDYMLGDKPFALYTGFIQTPIVQIPEVTFHDNNNNGVYDEGIDISLASGMILNGINSYIENINGSKNADLTSSIEYIQTDPVLGDPKNVTEVRAYMHGNNRYNKSIDPCSWYLGTTNFSNCANVNPHLWYSGNPVNKTGWINCYPSDKRMMITCGPFNLEKDKPADIIVAYTVGQGGNSLNSITVAKANYEAAKAKYKSFPVGNERIVSKKVKDLYLSQNYPNPFNPITVIKFSLPLKSNVSLKVYDILGREVKTLINGIKEAGIQEIPFEASNLSSGIYFYRLETQDFTQTRKMILLK